MPLNALLLPLVGGFLFLVIFHRTAYFLGRQSPAMLGFWLATAGLSLLVASRGLILVCEWAASDSAFAAQILLNWIAPPLFVLGSVGIIFSAVHTPVKRIRDRRWRMPVGAILLISFLAGFLYLAHNAISIRTDKLGVSIDLLIWIGATFVLVAVIFSWARSVQAPFGVLAFRGALLGLVFVLAPAVAILEIEHTNQIWLAIARPATSTINPEALATVSLACLLGPLLALAFNFVYPRTAVVARLASTRSTNSLERLLYDASRRAKMVMLTLNDGKVYCGWVDWLPGNPRSPDAYLEILPSFSGYRETETRRVHLPVNYLAQYTSSKRKPWRQFKKIIPLASIVTAGEFEVENFERFASREK